MNVKNPADHLKNHKFHTLNLCSSTASVSPNKLFLLFALLSSKMWFGKQVRKRSTFQNSERRGGEDYNKPELNPVRSGAAPDWVWLAQTLRSPTSERLF